MNWKDKKAIRDDNRRYRKKVLKSKRKNNYYKYLESSKWAKKKRIILKRANGMCEICKRDKPLQIHHKTYIRLFAERPSDLLAICGECHKLVHSLLTEKEIVSKIDGR